MTERRRPTKRSSRGSQGRSPQRRSSTSRGTSRSDGDATTRVSGTRSSRGTSRKSSRGTRRTQRDADSQELRGTRRESGSRHEYRDYEREISRHPKRPPARTVRQRQREPEGIPMYREEYGQAGIAPRSRESRRRREERLRRVRGFVGTRPQFPFRPLIAIVAALLVAAVVFLVVTNVVKLVSTPQQTQETTATVVKSKGGLSTAIADSSKLFTTTYDWDNLSTKSGRITYKASGKTVSRTGIDVSEHNGAINWTKVAADGIDFAYIRIGYRGSVHGNIKADKRFAQNFAGAKKAGLDIGVYFFSQATTTKEAKAEARYVVKKLGGYATKYPIVFDMEPSQSGNDRVAELSNAQLTAVAQAFCKEVESLGYHACVYGSRADLAHYDLASLADYGFWYAEYADQPTMALRFALWQYSSTATVDGIDGNVDLDLDLTTALKKVQAKEKSKSSGEKDDSSSSSSSS
ncbi:MAG: glycoside hydrolase family 25 protein [Parafannyhessea sp.]|uniref:glycoside hydrolase family 25 protein n=1 Tax=Parafannyhessea sp. TaxID=2847324 RepID=UPI003F0B64B9